MRKVYFGIESTEQLCLKILVPSVFYCYLVLYLQFIINFKVQNSEQGISKLSEFFWGVKVCHWNWWEGKRFLCAYVYEFHKVCYVISYDVRKPFPYHIYVGS